ncbi:Kanadaptin [Gryganskiella cystojenkinii]|nr:Kanadaptin [Gryganskiella cystojenkinii]
MSFAVPQAPARKPISNDQPAVTGNSASTETPVENNAKESFVMPAIPVKKSAMAPPPPPLFPKPSAPSSEDKERKKGDMAPPTIRPVTTLPKEKPAIPNAPPLKYQKPDWSGYPNQQFFFEVIKNGLVVERIMVPEKEFLVVGRLPMCDLEMEHPSLSRYHAVIQFKSNGQCYIYDLNSSHGTKLNKSKIPPGMHVSLKPGDQLRFGESTRIYLFQTEEEVDQEEEDRKLVQAMIEKQNRTRSDNRKEDDEGCNWGMQEDAMDDDDMDDALMDGSVRRAVDPDAYYRKDPKKALRHYLESKGYGCEYETEESGPGHAREYTARIRLPIETTMGPIYGEATTGKKRDAEREAALDACIKLDSRGMLGNHGSSEVPPPQSKGKRYDRSDDDDDDDFYDRTAKKKSSVKKAEQKADTHESLLEKLSVLQNEMKELKSRIDDYDANQAARKKLEESGDLDAFMASLEKSGGDSKAKLQQNYGVMAKEEKRLLQLIEFTKPVDFLSKIGSTASSSSSLSSLKSESSTTAKDATQSSSITTLGSRIEARFPKGQARGAQVQKYYEADQQTRAQEVINGEDKNLDELNKIRAYYSVARDLDHVHPLLCLGLKSLHTFIKFERRESNAVWDEQVLGQLSSRTRIRRLNLVMSDTDNKERKAVQHASLLPRRGLGLALQSGLTQLKTLRKLEEFTIRGSDYVSDKEDIRWMMMNFPSPKISCSFETVEIAESYEFETEEHLCLMKIARQRNIRFSAINYY